MQARGFVASLEAGSTNASDAGLVRSVLAAGFYPLVRLFNVVGACLGWSLDDALLSLRGPWLAQGITCACTRVHCWSESVLQVSVADYSVA